MALCGYKGCYAGTRAALTPVPLQSKKGEQGNSVGEKIYNPVYTFLISHPACTKSFSDGRSWVPKPDGERCGVACFPFGEPYHIQLQEKKRVSQSGAARLAALQRFEACSTSIVTHHRPDQCGASFLFRLPLTAHSGHTIGSLGGGCGVGPFFFVSGQQIK
jgi:hypothetical protein